MQNPQHRSQNGDAETDLGPTPKLPGAHAFKQGGLNYKLQPESRHLRPHDP